MKGILHQSPRVGVNAVRPLVEETYRLIEAQMLGGDTASAWNRLNQTRPIWDRMPDS